LTGAKEESSRVKKVVWRIETARKITQFFSFILLNAVIFGLGPWPIVLPVVHSLGVHQKTMGDAFAMLQWMLHESVFPWLPLASFFLVAVFLGRALCGWVCPFGFVQDLLGYIKRKHTEISLRNHEWMIKIKYIVFRYCSENGVRCSLQWRRCFDLGRATTFVGSSRYNGAGLGSSRVRSEKLVSIFVSPWGGLSLP